MTDIIKNSINVGLGDNDYTSFNFNGNRTIMNYQYVNGTTFISSFKKLLAPVKEGVLSYTEDISCALTIGPI